MDDRPHLLLMFKSILYAENEDEVEDQYMTTLCQMIWCSNIQIFASISQMCMKSVNLGHSVTEQTYP